MLCRQKTGVNSSSVKSAVRREDEAIQTELATGRQTENRHSETTRIMWKRTILNNYILGHVFVPSLIS